MGQHERSEHVAASSPLGAHDPGRTNCAIREQTRVPGVSPQAPHPLRVSVSEGSANGTSVEARVVASFEDERAALLELLERIGAGPVRAGGRLIPVWATDLARMGCGHVQTRRSSSKAVRSVGREDNCEPLPYFMVS